MTNLDRYTEWELMHEMDSGQASELEFFSRANLGEVMPFAMSHHALTFSVACWNLPGFVRMKSILGLETKHYCPYFLNFFGCVFNQMFMNLKNVSVVAHRCHFCTVSFYWLRESKSF